MPPKYLQKLLAANAAAKNKPKRPLLKVSWEDEVKSKPRFKKSATTSSLASSVLSKPNYWDFANSPLIKNVAPTSQYEEDELNARRNPSHYPQWLPSDTHSQKVQLLRRYKEFHGRLHPSKEAKEQQRALAKLSAQSASPIDMRPFESNYFRQ